MSSYFYVSDIDVIDIALVSLYALYEKATGLRYLFYQVELRTRLGQRRKYKQKIIGCIVRDERPQRSKRYVLDMYQVRARAGRAIDQVRGLPDADQHILRCILEVTVHVYKRVFQELRSD